MKKYQIIYADPPWSFSQGINPRVSFKENFKEELHKEYSTLSNKEIQELLIKSITDDRCILFLWTTDAHLVEAIKCIKSWGFKYKTIAFIWNKKEKSGKQVAFMGKWTVKGSEICLLATKGTAHKLLKDFKIRQLVEAERRKHSQKPDEVRKNIEKMFGDIPRIELFARQKTEGWDIWGNEVESDITL